MGVMKNDVALHLRVADGDDVESCSGERGGEFAGIDAGVMAAVGNENGGFDGLGGAVDGNLLEGGADLGGSGEGFAIGGGVVRFFGGRGGAERNDFFAEFVAVDDGLLADVFEPALFGV